MQGRIDHALAHFEGVRASGQGFVARCPAHDDTHPSLSIAEGDDGRVLLHCHAGCPPERIIERAGLAWEDLFPEDDLPTNGQAGGLGTIAKTYSYTDADGHLLYQTVRFVPKTFRQRRPDGRGGWRWDLKGVEPMLYRLPAVLRAVREGRTVFLVEGEKDADALHRLGLTATTSPMGAGKWRDAYAETLAEGEVVIVPDADEAGQRHAEQVARSLHGRVKTVRILRLPGLPEKGDVSDWLRRGGTADELVRLAAQAPPYAPSPAGIVEDAWPVPQPFSRASAAPAAFEPFLLPDTLGDWVEDVAERMQVPLDYPGIGIMITAAAALGRKLGIRPKRYDDFTVVPNLWGGIVGRPGYMKSPALAEVLKPLRRLEAEAGEAYHEEKARYEAERQRIDAKRSEINKRLKEASGPATAQAILDEYEVHAPRWRRYIVNDPSPEKLGEILRDNPQGILLFRDELAGWFASLRKAGNEGARKFYLEAWAGTEGYTFDRIGRGTVRIEHVCVSMLGSIQPDALMAYLHDGLHGGAGDDGLLQRFQLLVWPKPSPDFVNIDRWPNKAAKQAAYETIMRLARLDPYSVGAEADDDRRRDVPYLRFDDEAQEVFDGWRVALEARVRSGQEAPAFESHLAKYRSLMPSLALLYHVAAGWRGPVEVKAVAAAMEWVRYLESHARRIYAPAREAEGATAELLARRLLVGDLADGFTVRDLYRKGWSGLKTSEKAAAAVEVLVEMGWLRPSKQPTRGRVRTASLINPAIYGLNGQAGLD